MCLQPVLGGLECLYCVLIRTETDFLIIYFKAQSPSYLKRVIIEAHFPHLSLCLKSNCMSTVHFFCVFDFLKKKSNVCTDAFSKDCGIDEHKKV